MKKGISFYYGFNSDPEIRAKLIKEEGFDCVITNADKRFNNQNGSIKKQERLFKKYGIGKSSLHFAYVTSELPYFWQDCCIGNRMERSLKSDVKLAHKYGYTCVVVHVQGVPSEVGVNRIKRVLKLCEKLNVPLAFENIDDNAAFEYVMDNFKSEYVKFCYDSGHAHAFKPKIDYLKKYGDRLITVHLHDNMRNRDAHALNRFGSIDWDKIAKSLAKCREVNLDYELLMRVEHNMTEEEVLAECFKQAQELEQNIKYYQTNNTTKQTKSASSKPPKSSSKR